MLAFAWAIAYVSSLSSPEHHFHSFIHTVNSLNPIGGNIFSRVSDQMYHLTEYTVLGLLTYRAIRFSWGEQLGPVSAFITVITITLFGLSDELHQLFVPFRRMESLDLMADTVGGLVGVLLWEWALTFSAIRLLEEHLPSKLQLIRTTSSKC